jgi:hypothetical protein
MQLLPSSAVTAVQFDTIDAGLGMTASLDGTTVTAATSGLYLVHAEFTLTSPLPAPVSVWISKNAGKMLYGKQETISSHVSLATVISLSDGDIFEVQAAHTAGTLLTIDPGARLEAVSLLRR